MVFSSRVFIVDDESKMCESLKFLLEREGLNVETSTNGTEALEVLSRKNFDLCLLDICLPEMNGFYLLEQILQKDPDTPVIMMTGKVSIESAVKAIKKGAYDYLRKPFEYEDLMKTVKNGLEQKKLKVENRLIQGRLKLSENRYQYLVQNSPDLIYTLDQNGKFTFVNDAFKRLLRYESKQLLGKPYYTVVHKSDHEKAKWLFNERRTGERAAAGVELRLVYPEDSENFKQCEVNHITIELKSTGMYDLHLEDEGKEFLGTYGVARDISARKQLEAQLHQAQKMEAIGTLAGGIAHDFNNLLMGIQGYVSLILAGLDRTHPDYKKLNCIEEHVQSGAQLTRQLLGFARDGKYDIKPVNIKHLLEKTAAMFGRTKKEISLHKQFEPNLRSAEADEGQISQVLLNLYVNAWHAMPQGGHIYIKAENCFIDNRNSTGIGLKPGNYIKISVRDTGVGMDEDIQERIFEPFFTTKKRSRGTGLGLASAYGIINNHGGKIRVFSEKGQGSTFEIYLPATMKSAVEVKKNPQKIISGEKTVLLVDDEENIIEVTCKMLECMGYKVITATSGREAIEIFRKKSSGIDLCILDMIMPDLGGGETFDFIKKINSDVKVLLSSGYSLKGKAQKIIKRGCDGFIQKPFRLEDLSEKISGIFERKTG